MYPQLCISESMDYIVSIMWVRILVHVLILYLSVITLPRDDGLTYDCMHTSIISIYQIS